LEGLSYNLFGETLLLNYYNSRLNGDTIKFYKVSLNTKVIDSFNIVINGFSMIEQGQIMLSIALHENRIAILLRNRLFICDLRIDAPTSIKRFVLDEEFTAINFFNFDKLCLARSYNYLKLKNFENTKICTINLNNGFIENCITPEVDNIELTQMKPYSTIEISNNRILVGQNNTLKFSIFDTSLKEFATFSDTIVNQNSIDPKTLNKINKKCKSKRDFSELLSYLMPVFLRGYSFCDGYFLLDSNTILVRYTDGKNTGDTIYRMFTTIEYDKEKMKFNRTGPTYIVANWHSNITENMMKEVITKKNYYQNFWINTSVFTMNKTLVFAKKTNVYPIGLTYGEYRREEKKFLSTQDPQFLIYIFNNSFVK